VDSYFLTASVDILRSVDERTNVMAAVEERLIDPLDRMVLRL
jgi:hypothetical protein